MFDTHAHYNNGRYDEEYEGGVNALLTHLFKNGLSYCVNVGWDLDSSILAIEQAKKYENMYVAAGIHPCDADDIVELDSEMARLDEMIANRKENKIVLLGEIGLDYHYEDTVKDKQKEAFRRQLDIARKYGIPVSIHDREAHGDTMDILREYPDVKGILHSFSGSYEMADELIKRGWYISFSGVVTFKNAARVQDIARRLPMERILVETDCPYLAPHPHRGDMNHSGLIPYILETIGDLHGISAEKCREITTINAKEFLL